MKTNQNNSTKRNRISRREKLLLVFIVLSMIPLFFAAKSVFTIFAQTRTAQTKNKQEKVIKKVSFDNEPIEFLKLESDGKTVKPDEKFIQEDDWLKDFTIKFKNTSGKPITFVSMVLLFPETGPNGSPLSYPLNYGIHPRSKVVSNEKLRLLAPNDTAEVKISAENFKALKNFLSSRSLLSDLTEVNFRVTSVHFEDGTHWAGGTYWIPDPNNAGKFIPATEKNQEEKQ